MYTRSSTTRRFKALYLVPIALALVLFAMAGPGSAAPQAGPEAICEDTCIHADGVFGPTVPVSIDIESAYRLVAIIDGDSGQDRPATMDFMSVTEGSTVAVLGTDDRVATVRFDSGRVGYVPVSWVHGA